LVFLKTASFYFATSESVLWCVGLPLGRSNPHPPSPALALLLWLKILHRTMFSIRSFENRIVCYEIFAMLSALPRQLWKLSFDHAT